MFFKIIFISYLLIFSVICHSQDIKPNLNKDLVINKNINIENNNLYTLIMVSSPYCGFCRKSLKVLEHLKNNPNLNIIIYNFEGEESARKIYSNKYFDYFLFINADKDPKKTYDKIFFPRFYLYKKNKLVWTKKGYYKNLDAKILKRIK